MAISIEPILDETLGIRLTIDNIKRQPTNILTLFMLITSPHHGYFNSVDTQAIRYSVSKELMLRHAPGVIK